ncbi:MAG TPA: hypothetical protein VI094_08195 [Propionibacteriaceae bacterium]
MLGTTPRPGPDGDQWMGARRLAALGYIARTGGARAAELVGRVSLQFSSSAAVLLAEVDQSAMRRLESMSTATEGCAWLRPEDGR